MTTRKKKKPSPVGCLIYLSIIIISFVFLPWQVALGLTIAIFIIMLLLSGIVQELRKIKQRNITQKSLINQATEGFTELVVRLQPKNKQLQTWIEKEPADYRWTSFQHFYRPKNRNENNQGHWASFFDDESESKFFTAYDGSGSCIVLPHMADFRIKTRIKRYKPTELLQRLQDNQIDGFPFDQLKKDETVRVEEMWIPKGQEVYLYGELYKVDRALPDRLVSAMNDSRWSGGDYRNNDRKLDDADWDAIRASMEESSDLKPKILASAYERDPVNSVIISLHDDRKVNLMSFLSIFVMGIGLVFVIFVGLFILKSDFPELFDKIISLFS